MMPASSRTAIRNALVMATLLSACAQDRVVGPSASTPPKSLGLQANYSPSGNQGCSPGFWKNHPDVEKFWEYLPGQNLDPVFAVPPTLVANVTLLQALSRLARQAASTGTLLQALSFPGGPGARGGAQILLRAAVAALLNAASPVVEYPLSQSDVISQVNTALATGNRETMLLLASQLDGLNNLGCPLP